MYDLCEATNRLCINYIVQVVNNFAVIVCENRHSKLISLKEILS